MQHQRMLPLARGVNIREMGGYPTVDGRTTRWQKLIRSGNMGQLTPKDLDFLAEYGLRYDIDLRSESETWFYQDRYPVQTKYINLSLYPFERTLFENLGVVAGHQLRYGELDIVDQTYAQMMTDPHPRAQFRQMFDYLLENDQPDQSVLFHCAAGKDRTGAAAFLILSALGVKEEAILQDYLLTNLVFQNKTPEEINGLLTTSDADALANELNSYLAVSERGFKTFRQVCETVAGSMEQYFARYLDLDHDQLTRLQDIYLE